MSLTINDVVDDASTVTFGVMLIPHTLGATTLGDLKPGSTVNIEADVLARYVARQLGLASGAANAAHTSPHGADTEGEGVSHREGEPHSGAHHGPSSASDAADHRLRDKLQKGGFG